MSKFRSPFTLPATGSLTGLAASFGEVLTSDDLANDPRLEPDTRAALQRTGYAAAASVPLIHDGEVLGAFNLLYPPGLGLAPGERRLLDTLGRTLAIAMAQRTAVERERELEAQARRGAPGSRAAGIAHDFNNLLTGLVGAVDLARVDAEDAGLTETVTTLEEALAAADRTAGLVRQLLLFSRNHAPSRRLVTDLDRVVREAASFAARGTTVRCEVDIPAPLGSIEVDPGQIGQVVQNLVINACQASASGSSVVVRADRSESVAPEENPRVRITVADTGHGIPEEQLPRIFEPYFSARAGGMGLGLSVSHSIVARHGGRLTVSSTVGRGSTFTIELPASRAVAPAEERPSVDRARFEGRAIVMDDEPAVRKVAGLMLEQIGFEVDLAEDGARALVLAQEAAAAGRPYRVALLDLTIVGGLGAADIEADLRRLSPPTRLILSTGYAHGRAGDDWDATLAKPYVLAVLREAVTTALSEAAEAAARCGPD
jgi:signal transduction histidine kinase/CheY-like chemotaxis protein